MENKIFSKVFMWMFIGLAITFATAFYVSLNENMVYNIFSGSLYWILLLAQIGAVLYLSVRIHKMSVETSKIVFIGYSFLTGLTFSIIFLAFGLQTIIFAFGLTSIVFLIFALLGYYTNIDLTKIRTYLILGLIFVILAPLANIFIQSSNFDLFLLVFGVLLFMGFIAYDIQKIKYAIYKIENEEKAAIFGALQLYLDFINLFIRILRLLSRSRK